MEIEQATTNEKGVTDYGDTVSENNNNTNNNRRGMYLVWEDLTVVVPNFGNGHTRRLLDGLSGFAEPNRIMAIMGPSGSGKSTLLDALAGLSPYLSPLVCVHVILILILLLSFLLSYGNVCVCGLFHIYIILYYKCRICKVNQKRIKKVETMIYLDELSGLTAGGKKIGERKCFFFFFF